MNQGYGPQFRPMVIWRWQPHLSRDEILFALDQAGRVELGGMIIALAGGDDTHVAECIAQGAACNLVMGVALPDPPANINPLSPLDVLRWLEATWAPMLVPGDEGIPGLSTVVINALRPPVPVPGQRWDALFTEAFLDQKGYLPDRTHTGRAQVLVDINDVYTTLVATAWYGVVGGWCREHHFSLVGCVADATSAVTNPEAVSKYVAEVDIAALSLPIDRQAPLLEKLIHSASVLSMSQRTAAVLGHGPLVHDSLDNLKHVTERLVVAGVDMIIVDGFGPLSADTGLSYQMPQWRYVHHWTRYCGLLCETFAEARDFARVAILDPATSSWARAGQRDARSVAAQFESLRMELDDAQVAYLIIDEHACEHLVAIEDRLYLRGRWFDALIVPAVTHLRESTITALRHLADQSRIFAFGAADDVEVIAAYGNPPPRRASLRSIEGILFTYGDTLRRSDVFWHAIPRTIVMSSGADIRWRRVDRDGTSWCLGVNEGMPRSITASLDWSGEVSIFDEPAGEFRSAARMPGAAPGVANVIIDLMDQPAVLLKLEQGVELARAIPRWKGRSRIEIGGPWHFTPHDGNILRVGRWPFHITLNAPIANVHVLAIGKCGIQIDGCALSETIWGADPAVHDYVYPHLAAGDHVFTAESEPGLAWLRGDFALLHADPPEIAPVSEMPVAPWEACGFPDFSGTATYTTDFTLPTDFERDVECFLTVPGASGVVEMELNGETVAIRPWPPYRACVTKLLRPGSNLVSITMSNTLSNMMSGPDAGHPSGLVEPPYLEFGVWSRIE